MINPGHIVFHPLKTFFVLQFEIAMLKKWQIPSQKKEVFLMTKILDGELSKKLEHYLILLKDFVMMDMKKIERAVLKPIEIMRQVKIWKRSN